MSQSYNKAGWLVLLSCTVFSVLWVLYFMIWHTPADLGEVMELPPPVAAEVVDISSIEDYWVESI